MKFKIDLDISPKTIRENWPSFYMIGSCFAQEQAKRMTSLKLKVEANPFGIIYNPSSISLLLDRIAKLTLYSTQDFHHQYEEYFSWEHHGKFKFDSIETAISESNATLEKNHLLLKSTDAIVITLGTSLVYTYDGRIVANCHKLPNSKFDQRQLTYNETYACILSCIRHIRSVNKTAEIIFTVSPIRHVRSGTTASSRSKAVLISSIHEALDHTNDAAVSYFPSFEIFVDELRDYRFSKEDLVHPTEMASQYIWDKFRHTYFSDHTLELMADIQKLNTLKAHRPRNVAKHEASIKKLTHSIKLKYPKTSIL